MFVRPIWAWPRSVSSVILEPSTEEPITLEEAKLRAGLDWATTEPPDPRDQLMRDFIAAARDKVERDTGLALLTQKREITIAIAPGSVPPLPLPWQAMPVQSIVEVTGVRAGGERLGALFALTPRGVEVDLNLALVETLVLEVVSGWADPAQLRAEAPGLLQAVGLLTAHYATAGRDLVVTGTIATEIPKGYDDLIQPYRLEYVA